MVEEERELFPQAARLLAAEMEEITAAMQALHVPIRVASPREEAKSPMPHLASYQRKPHGITDWRDARQAARYPVRDCCRRAWVCSSS